jgi:MFS family permease
MNAPRIGKVVWAITAVYFFQASFARVYVLLPAYMAANGVSDPRLIGVLVGAFYLSTFARPFVGWFTDRAGFRTVLVWSGAVSTVAAAGMLFTNPHSTLLLITWRILAGASFSFFGVSLTAYQSEAVTGEDRGAGFSVVTAVAGLPYLLVVPFCELLVANGYLKSYLLVPVLLALVTCIGSLLLPHVDNPAAANRDKPGSSRPVLDNPQVWMLLLSITLFCSVDASLLSIAGLGRERGIAVSGFLAATAVTSVLVRFFGRSLIDHLPRVRTAWACGVISAIFMAVSTLAAFRGGILFVACGALYGVFIGLGYPALLALIADVAPPEQRSRVTSLFWFFMGLAYMGMPVVIGTLASVLRYWGAFLLVNLALVPLLWAIGRKWEKLQKSAAIISMEIQ